MTSKLQTYDHKDEQLKQPLPVAELPEMKIASADDDDHNHQREEPSTPTSSDQRISVIGPCPLVPRKPKPVFKRKGSPNDLIPSSCTAVRLLDFSKEVESMFPPLIRANLGCKIKRARRL